MEEVRHKPGGSGVLRYYNNSLIKALKTLYPEYKWQEWKFKMVSKRFWQSSENVKNYITSLAMDLGIKNADDWYVIHKHWLKILRT
jgi:hypothetical protein